MRLLKNTQKHLKKHKNNISPNRHILVRKKEQRYSQYGIFLFNKNIFRIWIQPTGKLHIGNYLGAVKNWINLQSKGQNIYCIVDYHALTDRISKDHQISFSQNTADETLQLASTLIASGLDYNNSIFFVQSHIPQHTELQWILSCIAPQNWLNIMTQIIYLSCFDGSRYNFILVLHSIMKRASHIPVGDDQKQHIELTREYVYRFNSLFKEANLVVPEYVECNLFDFKSLAKTPKIMSLRDASKKMSKSDQVDFTRINITDSKDLINEKIRKAKTDSINQIYYDVEHRPEVSNLLRIYSGFSNLTIEDIIKSYENKSIQSFKQDLIDIIIDELNPISQKTNELLQNKPEIIRILQQGQDKASVIAQKNIRKIKNCIGLL
ncbi:hypothetical protein pb186bvf_010281 [Paramecium bursaria]